MIAFIDIDGCMAVSGNPAFTPAAIEAVRLLAANGFQIVLHSTARADGRLEDVLDRFGNRGITLFGWVDSTEPSKAKAIAGWLDENYETWPRVIVIDDDPIDLRGVTHIRCNPSVGLTVEDVRKAMGVTS